LGGDADLEGAKSLVFLLWIVAVLLVSVQSASLIAGERSHQTLDVLATTPLTGQDSSHAISPSFTSRASRPARSGETWAAMASWMLLGGNFKRGLRQGRPPQVGLKRPDVPCYGSTVRDEFAFGKLKLGIVGHERAPSFRPAETGAPGRKLVVPIPGASRSERPQTGSGRVSPH